MAWTNADIAKVAVKDALVPSNTFYFDGMAAAFTGQFVQFTDPAGTYGAIQQILDIGGLSATVTGITRTIKQGDGSQ